MRNLKKLLSLDDAGLDLLVMVIVIMRCEWLEGPLELKRVSQQHVHLLFWSCKQWSDMTPTLPTSRLGY